MNRFFALLFFCGLIIPAHSQQLPNGSFEQWSAPYAPDAWGTWWSALSSYTAMSRFAAIDTAPGAFTEGRASLRLTTDTITLPGTGLTILSGFAALGGSAYKPPPTGQGIQFGILPFGHRPDSLLFDYRFTTPLGQADTALISIIMTHWSLAGVRDTILSLTLPLDTASQWTHINEQLTSRYDPANTLYPDTLHFIIFAGRNSLSPIGTSLWIDTIRFDQSVLLSVSEPSGPVYRATIYPNPFTGLLHIAIPPAEIGSSVTLYDLCGTEVYRSRLHATLEQLDITPFAEGSYFLIIESHDHLMHYRSGPIIRCK